MKTEAPAPAVQVVKAQTATLESAIEISGNLAPQTRVGIMPKLGGTLDRVLVDLGDRVSEGTVVATLDRREIDAQVDAAAAAVAVAKAAQEAAEASQANAAKEIERARNLFEQGAIAKAQLDAAETAHRTTSAQRELSRRTSRRPRRRSVAHAKCSATPRCGRRFREWSSSVISTPDRWLALATSRSWRSRTTASSSSKPACPSWKRDG